MTAALRLGPHHAGRPANPHVHTEDELIISSKKTTQEDPTIPIRPGFEGMHLWWLLDKDTHGTSGIVVSFAEFEKGVAHGLHRHANARETLYIERGSGLMFTRSEIYRVGPGDVITMDPGEWHAFFNDRDEPVGMLGHWDADNYADVAYEEIEDWRPEFEALRSANPGL